MASARLYKTGVASPTNDKKWTLSAWFKFSKPASGGHMYFASGGGSNDNWTQVRANSQAFSISGYSTEWLRTSAKLRDTNAWYHIVIAADSTQGTASNRLKIYINGEEASYGTDNRSSISQNQTWGWNKGSVVHNIGGENASGYGDFVMAHCHNVDGTVYTPTTFGETDATTGIWKPKTAPTVNYGNNGWFLKFDNSANMGLDSSGQGNNLTTGGTIIQTKDTPTNVFAKWNYNSNYFAGFPMSNVNTTATSQASGAYTYVRSTLGFSKGKYYWEVKASAKSGGSDWFIIGISSKEATSATAELGNYENDYGYRGDTGKVRYNNAEVTFGNTYGVGDIIGVAVDYDNGKIYFSKNGTWQNSGDPTSGSTGTGAISIVTPPVADNATGFYFPAICFFDGTHTGTFQGNFGDGYFGTTAVSSAQNPDDGIGIFEYDVPAGYRALCTKSLNAQEYS
jgi:hypothetical protein